MVIASSSKTVEQQCLSRPAHTKAHGAGKYDFLHCIMHAKVCSIALLYETRITLFVFQCRLVRGYAHTPKASTM
jgi:hypothetical protein